MRPFGYPLRDLRDGATGLCPDGSIVDLPTATCIELSSTHEGAVTVTLTRFFRSAGPVPIKAAVPIVSPPDAIMQRLTVRVGQCILDCAQAPGHDNAQASLAKPRPGLHVVTFPEFPAHDEAQITAELAAPLSISGIKPRLKLPTQIAHVLDPSAGETISDANTAPTAMVVVSDRAGIVLLHGRPIGEAPIMISARSPIELHFPGAAQDFQRRNMPNERHTY